MQLWGSSRPGGGHPQLSEAERWWHQIPMRWIYVSRCPTYRIGRRSWLGIGETSALQIVLLTSNAFLTVARIRWNSLWEFPMTVPFSFNVWWDHKISWFLRKKALSLHLMLNRASLHTPYQPGWISMRQECAEVQSVTTRRVRPNSVSRQNVRHSWKSTTAHWW